MELEVSIEPIAARFLEKIKLDENIMNRSNLTAADERPLQPIEYVLNYSLDQSEIASPIIIRREENSRNYVVSAEYL